jgi:hypothetical protein
MPTSRSEGVDKQYGSHNAESNWAGHIIRPYRHPSVLTLLSNGEGPKRLSKVTRHGKSPPCNHTWSFAQQVGKR